MKKNNLQVRLYSPDKYKREEAAELVFEVINNTNKPVHVLKWNTPLEGLKTPCLDVKIGNKLVPYDGKLIKRGAPTANDFITLAAGESIQKKIDLTEVYDLSATGNVTVSFNIKKFQSSSDTLSKALEKSAKGFTTKKDKGKSVSLEIKETSFKVSASGPKRLTLGEIARQKERQQKKTLKKLAKISTATGPLACKLVGGTTQQQALSKTAHANGYALAVAALAALANDANYKTWFGTHTAARLNIVKSNYQKVITKMQDTQFTYNLTGDDCDSGVFAYTYKGTTTIWFCEAFWTAQDTGTDSRAGTVVHEHTHATSLTDDVTYGQANCKQLAKDNPDSAIRNADSHEYYAGG